MSVDPLPPESFGASHYRTLLFVLRAAASGGMIPMMHCPEALTATVVNGVPMEGHRLRERLRDLAKAGLLTIFGDYPLFRTELTPFGLIVGQALGRVDASRTLDNRLLPLPIRIPSFDGAWGSSLDTVTWADLLREVPLALRPDNELNAFYCEDPLPSDGAWIVLHAGGRFFGATRIREMEPLCTADGVVARYASVEAAKAAIQAVNPLPPSELP